MSYYTECIILLNVSLNNTQITIANDSQILIHDSTSRGKQQYQKAIYPSLRDSV